MSGDRAYTVRAARCDHRASDEEIYATLRRITDPLTRSWEKIERANKVVIKLNMMKLPDRLYYFEGRRRELVDEFVDSNVAPFASYQVPGGGLMFDRYTLSGCFADADAMVSVAKMKNHAFMGVTLCMKNLFGLPPITLPAGRVRTYYHHVIRLPYVLADLGLILQPCL